MTSTRGTRCGRVSISSGGDASSAVELYRGPFLDGVHLVDLSSWETWVDSRRAHTPARFERLSLLETLESRDSQGDVAAIPFVSRATERFLRGEVLAALGQHADALRWFASLGHGSVTEVPLRAISAEQAAAARRRLGLRD